MQRPTHMGNAYIIRDGPFYGKRHMASPVRVVLQRFISSMALVEQILGSLLSRSGTCICGAMIAIYITKKCFLPTGVRLRHPFVLEVAVQLWHGWARGGSEDSRKTPRPMWASTGKDNAVDVGAPCQDLSMRPVCGLARFIRSCCVRHHQMSRDMTQGYL